MGQKQVVFSYLALLLSTSYVLYDLGLGFSQDNPLLFALCGYFLLFLTSLLGCIKFGLESTNDNMDKSHWILCWLSTSLVVALFGAQTLLSYGYDPYHYVLVAAGIAVLPASVMLGKSDQSRANGVVFSVGILTVLVVALIELDIWGVAAGAALLFGRLQSTSQDAEGLEYDAVKEMQNDKVFVGCYALHSICMHVFLTHNFPVF